MASVTPQAFWNLIFEVMCLPGMSAQIVGDRLSEIIERNIYRSSVLSWIKREKAPREDLRDAIYRGLLRIQKEFQSPNEPQFDQFQKECLLAFMRSRDIDSKAVTKIISEAGANRAVYEYLIIQWMEGWPVIDMYKPQVAKVIGYNFIDGAVKRTVVSLIGLHPRAQQLQSFQDLADLLLEIKTRLDINYVEFGAILEYEQSYVHGLATTARKKQGLSYERAQEIVRKISNILTRIDSGEAEQILEEARPRIEIERKKRRKKKGTKKTSAKKPEVAHSSEPSLPKVVRRGKSSSEREQKAVGSAPPRQTERKPPPSAIQFAEEPQGGVPHLDDSFDIDGLAAGELAPLFQMVTAIYQATELIRRVNKVKDQLDPGVVRVIQLMAANPSWQFWSQLHKLMLDNEVLEILPEEFRKAIERHEQLFPDSETAATSHAAYQQFLRKCQHGRK